LNERLGAFAAERRAFEEATAAQLRAVLARDVERHPLSALAAEVRALFDREDVAAH
jgi:hypothetical protein